MELEKIWSHPNKWFNTPFDDVDGMVPSTVEKANLLHFLERDVPGLRSGLRRDVVRRE
jgi:hypothetical protein